VVRVVPDLALHLPQNVTEQFNADFDGDEMNVHAPQTPQAIAELHLLLALPENFIAPNERPALGFIQNTLLAAFLVTDTAVLFTRAEACQLMLAACEPKVARRPCAETEHALLSTGEGFRARFGGKMLPTPAVQYKNPERLWDPPVQLWTGMQLISGLMPPIDVDGDALDFVMRQGAILAGRLTKRELGTGKGNLLHKVFLQFNGTEFMDR
jgi:hypothetical protein